MYTYICLSLSFSLSLYIYIYNNVCICIHLSSHRHSMDASLHRSPLSLSLSLSLMILCCSSRFQMSPGTAFCAESIAPPSHQVGQTVRSDRARATCIQASLLSLSLA